MGSGDKKRQRVLKNGTRKHSTAEPGQVSAILLVHVRHYGTTGVGTGEPRTKVTINFERLIYRSCTARVSIRDFLRFSLFLFFSRRAGWRTKSNREGQGNYKVRIRTRRREREREGKREVGRYDRTILSPLRNVIWKILYSALFRGNFAARARARFRARVEARIYFPHFAALENRPLHLFARRNWLFGQRGFPRR